MSSEDKELVVESMDKDLMTIEFKRYLKTKKMDTFDFSRLSIDEKKIVLKDKFSHKINADKYCTDNCPNSLMLYYNLRLNNWYDIEVKYIADEFLPRYNSYVNANLSNNINITNIIFLILLAVTILINIVISAVLYYNMQKLVDTNSENIMNMFQNSTYVTLW